MATQRVTRSAAAGSTTEKPLKLEVRSRGRKIKNLPEATYVEMHDSGKDIYDRIAAKARFPVNRLRITKASDGALIPNDKSQNMTDLNVFEGSSLFVKDLGPQIPWRTVFIIEYLGPLLIHPLIFSLRNLLYQNVQPATTSQWLSLLFIVIHFLKREYETVFVHRFSAATMPAFNIFKNSAHYWVLAGFNIAFFTYSSSSSCPTARDPNAIVLILATVLFIVGEVGNYNAHVILRDLRKPGTRDRAIPRGGVFDMIPVTCPNYFFETMAWAGILAANRSLSTLVFVIVAVGQMAVWARKKESRYRKEFGGSYEKKRFAMLPFIV